MRYRLGGYAVIALALAVAPQSHAGTIEGIWSTPILAGNSTDAVTEAHTFQNNTISAVDSISNSAGGSTTNWGTYNTNGVTNPPGVPDIAGCTFLFANNNGLPCQSTITFAGNTLPANTANPFTIGTLTYTNGTSNLDSLIFGATLTFVDSANPGTPLGSDFVEIVTTSNTGNATQNADYITFSGLAGQSFNVIEGTTATAGLIGFIDALTLTSLTLLSHPSTGFIGNSPSIPLTAPEPASLTLLGLSIIGLSLTRRR
jgi:hypothetical protein